MLEVAHKYSAEMIEKRARSLIIPLTNPQTIRSQLTETLTALRIVELGDLVGCEEALESAWLVATEDLETAGSYGLLGTEGPGSIRAMLDCVEKLGREDMLSEMYYGTMMRGHAVWGTGRLELRDHQVQALWTGMVQCAEQAEVMFRNWRAGKYFDHQCGTVTPRLGTFRESVERPCPYRAFAANATKRCDEEVLASFDLLGRLRAAAKIVMPSPKDRVYTECHQAILRAVKTALEYEKKHVWRRFRVDGGMGFTHESELDD